MSDDAAAQVRRAERGGLTSAIWGVVLSPVALFTAPLWFAGLLYTPFVLTGGGSVVGLALAISGFISFMGLVLSAGPLLDLRHRTSEDYRLRARIIRTGTWGIVLNVLTMLLMILLWFWIPIYG